MFTVIYSFSVKPNYENQFENAWAELTKIILSHEGSLGSRLHKESKLKYIAYAQWPSREKWENSGRNMPENSIEIREMMKSSCSKIETIHELEVVKDLLLN